MQKISEESILQIRQTAEEYYRKGELYCSEAVVKAVLDGFGAEFPKEVISIASGFPVGIGAAGCTCGAISGGVMAVSYLFGRRELGDERVADAMALSNGVYKNFITRNKISCCKILTRGMEKGTPEHMTQCIRFTGEVAEDTARLINERLD